MFKKIILYFLIITFLFSSLYFLMTPVYANEDNENQYDAVTVGKIMSTTNVMELKAKSSILLDAVSGKVLVEDNCQEKLPIASIAELLTML